MSALDGEQQDASDPAFRIASLLLAKLADYVVPGKTHSECLKSLKGLWDLYVGGVNKYMPLLLL